MVDVREGMDICDPACGVGKFLLEPLIIHSDRGSQYVAKEYKKATENMQCSYSKKAFPWDNACIESFHSIIKREWLNRFKIRDYKQAYQLIFEYLEAFYNTKRIRTSV